MVELMGWRAIGAKLMNFSSNIEMEWEEVPKEENPLPKLF
jgi:topoisomerase-4 subunit A